MYHLNPEAKSRFREHAFVQSQLPKRMSIVTANTPQQALPHPGSGLVPPRARTQGQASATNMINDPNSVICSVQ